MTEDLKRPSRNSEENWQRLVKRLRDMRAYGGRDYECMDDAADMIEVLVKHLESAQRSACTFEKRTTCSFASSESGRAQSASSDNWQAAINSGALTPLSGAKMTTVEFCGKPAAAPCAIEEQCQYGAVAQDAARYRWLKEQWSTHHGAHHVTWRFDIGCAEVYDFEPLVDKGMAESAERERARPERPRE